MLNIIYADGSAEQSLIEEMRGRATKVSAEISQSAAEILRDIAENGIQAVNKYSVKFDGCEAREITKDELKSAYEACSASLKNALEHAKKNIREYHEHMLAKSWEWNMENGSKLGQKVRGLERVGVYVPGGTAAYPSSVLMNIVPAKVAGVKEVIMVTPPTKNLNNAVLTAAYIAGVDRVIAIGGVQAIGALAYGAGFIPRVDKIVGPGNAYVAAAKRLVYGQVDIDMVAGPSEILVLADESAPAEYVAADLLSQAEHDPLASAILITTSEKLAKAVIEQVKVQTAERSRKDIIEKSLRDFGAVVVVPDWDVGCALADQIAPEHLEIMTREPEALAEKLNNAGALFLGQNSPEPLGDYMAGPCHVLPTSGTARFFSPLSTDSFLKKTSIISYTQSALSEISREIQELALSEGLDAHAYSIKVRGEK